MLDRLIAFSVHRPALAVIAGLFSMLAAYYAANLLPIDTLPDVTNVQVQINTPVRALAPETIETIITFPIESAMGAVPHVTEIRSQTRYGLSQVTVVFEDDTDIYFARQLLTEALRTVSLPEEVRPELGPITSGLGEVFFYTLDFREPATEPDARLAQLMQLRTIQEWDIKRRLLTVPGVVEVDTIGGHPEAYYIEPIPEVMARYGVHFHEIVDAIEENNRSVGGGYVQQTADQFLIHGDGLVESLAELRGLAVKVLPDYSVVRLGELARLGPGRELRTGAAVADGRETVLGTAVMLSGENSRVVARNVAARLQEIAASLPEDIVVKTRYDRADLVEGTIATVRQNLALGAMLVIVVLFLLTGNLRAALITTLVIPLSFALTLIAMYFMDVSANLMSLGALDFGVIIDGAVIVVDSCHAAVERRRRDLGRRLSRPEIRQTVADATVAIRRAAGFGQLIIIVVFVPVFALSGVEGRMFRPMAATFCFALVGAFVIAFSIVPALAGSLLSDNVGQGFGVAFMRGLSALYRLGLVAALRFRRSVLITAAVVLVAGTISYGRLGAEFIPQLYEGAAAFQFIRPISISMDQSIELERKAQEILLEFEEVEQVFGRIGTAEVATHPMGVNLGDTYVMLRDRDRWPEVDGRRRTPEELISAMQRALESRLPGQRLLASQPIQHRFNELLEGTRADVSMRIYGEDLDTLQHLSEEAAALLESVPGAGEVEPEVRGKTPMLVITPRDERLVEMGLSRRELLDAIDIGLGGHPAGYLYHGDRRFPLFVRLGPRHRNNLAAIRQLPVGIAESVTAPVSELADLRFGETFEMIKRDSFQRRSAVLLNPRGRDTASVVEDARRLIEARLDLPDGYHVEWGGNFENLEQARERLLIIAPLVLLIVSLMIYTAFRSWLRTVLVLVVVPFALVGGVLNLSFFGLPFSVSAAIGFIALSGIAVLNGVVLMSHYAELDRAGGDRLENTIQGASDRLRPVLMTALTDIFGFFPMMLATGLGAEVQRPIAAVVVGGIGTSTLSVLVLLPLLQHWLTPRFRQLEEERAPGQRAV